MDSVNAITNIVSGFAHRIDTRDFTGLAALCSRMTYTSSIGGAGFGAESSGTPAVAGVDELARYYERVLTDANASWLEGQKRHGDPAQVKTKHIFTNFVIDVASDQATAKAIYYGTVLAFTDELPLSIRYSGRYYDEFARDDGGWFIASRHQAHDYRAYEHPATTAVYL